MQLDIILRTHSTGNVHTWAKRYVPATKAEIMLRCVNSLITSINQADADPSSTEVNPSSAEASIRLWVVDDHSDAASLAKLNELLLTCKYPTNIASLEVGGTQASALAHFEAGKENGREVVYFVEDDYLHTPSAIQEMIDAYALFKKNLGREVALFPMDYPDRYSPQENELCRVVLGPKRHWRTITRTTNTCFLSKDTLLKRWDLFEMLANNYGLGKNITEENTINRIWRQDAVLFSPIPSLALHLQFEEHKDPYINWQAWWDAAKY